MSKTLHFEVCEHRSVFKGRQKYTRKSLRPRIQEMGRSTTIAWNASYPFRTLGWINWSVCAIGVSEFELWIPNAYDSDVVLRVAKIFNHVHTSYAFYLPWQLLSHVAQDVPGILRRVSGTVLSTFRWSLQAPSTGQKNGCFLWLNIAMSRHEVDFKLHISDTSANEDFFAVFGLR